ncbi:hypothetical protein [Methyloterricola oryzae]|uniref:hypothetical protein n=1 Tax=Methyloterricola oryzae TaxID=1495050 RepID=UPI0005EAD848|nr:hypothetical protein [Methyloterricola oryzae]
MMFDVWRMREQGWLLPRFRSCMIPPVRAILRLGEQRDHALNRHIRVAELFDPRTRQSLHDFPALWDTTLVAVDEASMTLTGTERIHDPQADREYVYAQSWFLRAVSAGQAPRRIHPGAQNEREPPNKSDRYLAQDTTDRA